MKFVDNHDEIDIENLDDYLRIVRQEILTKPENYSDSKVLTKKLGILILSQCKVTLDKYFDKISNLKTLNPRLLKSGKRGRISSQKSRDKSNAKEHCLKIINTCMDKFGNHLGTTLSEQIKDFHEMTQGWMYVFIFYY